MELETKQISLQDLAPTSKIWVYQSNRFLTDEEVDWVNRNLENFMPQWAAHGKQLFGAFKVFYNRFLVIAVDEAKEGASGCSIDSSVHFITQLGDAIKVDFFDRLQVLYKKENEILSTHFNQFEDLVKSGEVDENTIVFNNLVSNLAEFEQGWELPVKDSWHAKYL